MSLSVFMSPDPLFVLVSLQNWWQTRGWIIGATSHGCLTLWLLPVYESAVASVMTVIPDWCHRHQSEFFDRHSQE